MSPIFSDSTRGASGPFTDVSSLGRPPHQRDRKSVPYCAQFLCSQAACLHFRQFLLSCKCGAAITALLFTADTRRIPLFFVPPVIRAARLIGHRVPSNPMQSPLFESHGKI